jgi:FlaA1/EpsC-like NDP-sugar epimerase/lipopolysaccharide/colanic/teichoic acid biosynthesis glycosyltransferase
MFKRIFDILLAIVALMVLVVPMLFVALAIKLDSKGPVLFRQERVGRHGRSFRIFKFRTMYVDKGSDSQLLTRARDPRVTSLGARLRLRRIDEWPQLFNVLAGDMSFVGPRPEVPRYVQCYPSDLRVTLLSVRPGITDPAALAFRDEAALLSQSEDADRCYLDEVLPRKLKLQAQYVQKATFVSDLAVLWATVRLMLGLPPTAGRVESSVGNASRSYPSIWLMTLAVDGLFIWLAWQATYLFRLGFERWLEARPSYDLQLSLAVASVHVLVLWSVGAHRNLWRYTGLADIRRLVIASAFAGVSTFILVVLVLGLGKVPRAVLALHPLATVVTLSMVRLLTRSVHEHRQRRRLHGSRPPRTALVIGAGESARRLIAGIDGQGWSVLGLLDDDPLKWGARISNVPVLGPCDRLPEFAAQTGAGHLILSVPSLSVPERRQLIARASVTGLPVLTVPSALELQQGHTAGLLRELEPQDLLGRNPVELDPQALVDVVCAKTVAITGAGGSIGSELCLQVAACRPSRLLLIDHAEYALYRIHRVLVAQFPNLEVRARLLDVKDGEALAHALREDTPVLLLHAAAYKHVPLVEDGNAVAALSNNVLGTWRCAQAAALAGVQRFVLISTDKAVNPTNIMGASKRAAEQAMVALCAQYPSTAFMAVRFGNVLGSSGSVIPLFKEQLARGGPLTVTHPDVIRYFMTIPEACRLVLHAGAIGSTSQVMVLDMGEPVRILDLARTMITLSGHREQDIPIVFTGLRPGEKLFEELLAAEETTLPTAVKPLRVARLASAWNFTDMTHWIKQCEELLKPGQPSAHDRVLAHLKVLVPEYQPAKR